MSKDQSSRVMRQGALDDFAWVHCAGGETALKQGLHLDNLIAAIEEDYLEDFLF